MPIVATVVPTGFTGYSRELSNKVL